jgi:hypothetical protein
MIYRTIKMRDKLKTIAKILIGLSSSLFLIFLIILLIATIASKESYNNWYRDCTTKILQDLNHN